MAVFDSRHLSCCLPRPLDDNNPLKCVNAEHVTLDYSVQHQFKGFSCIDLAGRRKNGRLDAVAMTTKPFPDSGLLLISRIGMIGRRQSKATTLCPLNGRSLTAVEGTRTFWCFFSLHVVGRCCSLYRAGNIGYVHKC